MLIAGIIIVSLISRVSRTTEPRGHNPVPGTADVLFLEIDVIDPSEFSDTLQVRGVEPERCGFTSSAVYGRGIRHRQPMADT